MHAVAPATPSPCSKPSGVRAMNGSTATSGRERERTGRTMATATRGRERLRTRRAMGPAASRRMAGRRMETATATRSAGWRRALPTWRRRQPVRVWPQQNKVSAKRLRGASNLRTIPQMSSEFSARPVLLKISLRQPTNTKTCMCVGSVQLVL